MLTLQEHVMYYQEQHNLFLFSKDYIRDTLHWEGLQKLGASFLTQFYYYPLLGAAIVSLMLASIYLMIESAIEIFTGRKDWFQVGALIAVALYFTLDGTDESPFLVAVTFLVMLLLMILLQVVPMKRKDSRGDKLKTRALFMSIGMVLLYCAAGFWIEMSLYSRDERSMILAERAVNNKDWDKVIDITSRYLATGKNNRLMLYFRNLALANKGELTLRLFDYPQKLGINGLAFPWTRNSRETEHGHLFHEATGDINAAHFWTFEGMTVWGETAGILSRLGHYNAALGRKDVALKFADKLDKSLFHKAEAESIRKEAERPGSGVYYAMPDSVSVDWLNIADFRQNLMQNFLADPHNVPVRQYLIAGMLLSNSIGELLPYLEPQDLQSKPVREALTLYSRETQDVQGAADPIEDDAAMQKDLARFIQLYKAGDHSRLIREYAHTFWFYRYFHFDSKNP